MKVVNVLISPESRGPLYFCGTIPLWNYCPTEGEGGRKRGREGGREGRREGGKEGEREGEGGKEGRRKGEREGVREGGKEGVRKGRSEGGMRDEGKDGGRGRSIIPSIKASDIKNNCKSHKNLLKIDNTRGFSYSAIYVRRHTTIQLHACT